MTFSIREALKFGWEQTKKHNRLLFIVVLILVGLEIFEMTLQNLLKMSFVGGVLDLAMLFAQYIFGVGFALIALRVAQHKHTELKQIIPPLEVLWRYFASTFLVGLYVCGAVLGVMLSALALGAAIGGGTPEYFPAFLVVGIFTSIMAGMYISLRYSMVRFAVLDGIGIKASLKCSEEMTRGYIWQLFWFNLLLMVINLIGLVLLAVGLLVTLPVTFIAYAHVYQRLHSHSHSH